MEKIQRIKAIIDRTLPEHIAVRIAEKTELIEKNLMPYSRIKLTTDTASIEHALAISNGVIFTAAELLGVTRETVSKWIDMADIDREDYVFDGRSPGLFKLRKKGGAYEEFRRESRKLFYEFFEEELA